METPSWVTQIETWSTMWVIERAWCPKYTSSLLPAGIFYFFIHSLNNKYLLDVQMNEFNKCLLRDYYIPYAGDTVGNRSKKDVVPVLMGLTVIELQFQFPLFAFHFFTLRLHLFWVMNCFDEAKIHVCACWGHFRHDQLFAVPWTVAHQAPLFMGLSR